VVSQMEKSQTMSQPASQSQSNKFEDCLLVSRHYLLSQQEQDLARICGKITRIETLPNDLNELKKIADFYDAIIGIIPLPIQVQLLQLRKNVLLFYMESVGTATSKTEAEQLLAKAGGEGVILPPARDGEPFRVSIYKGIKLVKKIVVEDEFIIQH